MEGLQLIRSSQIRSASGFAGVYPSANRFLARHKKGGIVQHLGSFGTAAEAALAYARHLASLGVSPHSRGSPDAASRTEASVEAEAEGMTLGHMAVGGPGQYVTTVN